MQTKNFTKHKEQQTINAIISHIENISNKHKASYFAIYKQFAL